jgi:cell wall-associated NlpC family hydrolase
MQKFFLLLLVILFSACVSSHPNASSYQTGQADPAMNELAVYAISLAGTPYKYGGMSPETGFDCSGFVGHVFKQTLGESLPRSTEEISRIGVEQDEDRLLPGDLVFYNTLNRSNSHVGIYLGDGQFIHSPSTGKSVTVVNMNESYWRKRYNGARRIKP